MFKPSKPSHATILTVFLTACGDDGTNAPPQDGDMHHRTTRDASASEGGACESATGFCIRASGTRQSGKFSCSTEDAAEDPVVRWSIGTPSWGLGCQNEGDEVAVELQFPVQDPGSFSYSMSGPLDAQDGFEFLVRAAILSNGPEVGGMGHTSSNLTSATLEGTLSEDKRATGVLRATWGEPDAACESGTFNAPCTAGSVEIVFDVPVF